MSRLVLYLLLSPLVAMLQPHALAAQWVEVVCSIPQTHVSQLILKLGDDEFETRQQATQELLEIGVAAWDELYHARSSSNAEIARAARRLLDQIPFENELRKFAPVLKSWRHLEVLEKERLIIQLNRMQSQESQIALALLTKFELDETLSMLAAIELVTMRETPVPAVEACVANSPRTASRWVMLRSLSAQHSVSHWQTVNDELNASAFGELRPVATRRMRQWICEQYLVAKEMDLARDMARQVTQTLENRPGELIEIADWLWFIGFAEQCEAMLLKHKPTCQSDIRLIYRLAEAARRRGDLSGAHAIASCSADLKDVEVTHRLQAAVNLSYCGLAYWSDIELQIVLAQPNLDADIKWQSASMLAEGQLARREVKAAVNSISLAIDCLDEQGQSWELMKRMKTRRHFMKWQLAMENRDFDGAERELLQGLQLDPDNTDLLLAMHRYVPVEPGRADAWHVAANDLVQLSQQRRLEKIGQLRSATDKDARQARAREEHLGIELNRFAWVASQTGADLTTAEQFSREALNMSPFNSHYLDTLAACLFAQVRIEEAIAVQRRAWKQAPWSTSHRDELYRYRQAMRLAELPINYGDAESVDIR